MIFKSTKFGLRYPLPGDAKRIYEISQNNEVMRYYGSPQFKNFDEARQEINWFQSLNQSSKGLRWIITDTKNQCIGSIGYFNYDKERNSVEVSYQLDRRYWGQGIASQALELVIQHAFEEGEVCFVIAYAHVNNHRSQKVLERNLFEKVINYVPEISEKDRLHDCLMYIKSKGQ